MHRLLLLLLVVSSTLPAQTTLRFEPWFAEAPLVIDEEEGAAAGAELRIEKLRLYLSGFVLLRAGEVVFTEPESYHLLDAARPESLVVQLDTQEEMVYDSVRFFLGVDSTRAAAGVFGGDLDPTNGMYWTWRSGYINFKLEGTAPDCPARAHRFLFHVGGYQSPYNSQRTVVLARSASGLIRIDLDHLLGDTDLGKDFRVMSPNAAAMQLADRLVGIFSPVNHP